MEERDRGWKEGRVGGREEEVEGVGGREGRKEGRKGGRDDVRVCGIKGVTVLSGYSPGSPSLLSSKYFLL